MKIKIKSRKKNKNIFERRSSSSSETGDTDSYLFSRFIPGGDRSVIKSDDFLAPFATLAYVLGGSLAKIFRKALTVAQLTLRTGFGVFSSESVDDFKKSLAEIIKNDQEAIKKINDKYKDIFSLIYPDIDVMAESSIIRIICFPEYYLFNIGSFILEMADDKIDDYLLNLVGENGKEKLKGDTPKSKFISLLKNISKEMSLALGIKDFSNKISEDSDSQDLKNLSEESLKNPHNIHEILYRIFESTLNNQDKLDTGKIDDTIKELEQLKKEILQSKNLSVNSSILKIINNSNQYQNFGNNKIRIKIFTNENEKKSNKYILFSVTNILERGFNIPTLKNIQIDNLISQKKIQIFPESSTIEFDSNLLDVIKKIFEFFIIDNNGKRKVIDLITKKIDSEIDNINENKKGDGNAGVVKIQIIKMIDEKIDLYSSDNNSKTEDMQKIITVLKHYKEKVNRSTTVRGITTISRELKSQAGV